MIGFLNKVYPYGAQEWNVDSINKTSGEKLISGILKATNNGLRQQLHLSPSDIKVSCISTILLTLVLCTTMNPNVKFSGNFFGLDMGLTNSEKAIYNFIYFHSTQHCLQVKKQLEIGLNLFSTELFERKLVVHFLLYYSRKWFFRKGFDPEHWWEIYLVACGF